MSKRTRYGDNSKRQQPVQQQRAQARQPSGSGPSNASKEGSASARPGRVKTAANDAKH